MTASPLFVADEQLLERSLAVIGNISQTASRQLSKVKQAKFAQYFTEGVIAQTMAKRLSISGKQLTIGDHGAGAGVLGATTLVELLRKHTGTTLNLKAYEIDDNLHPYFFESMAAVEQFACDTANMAPIYSLKGDFSSTDLQEIEARRASLSGAVINPPYQKLHQGSDIAQFMREQFVSVPNQYALFVVLTVDMLKDGGEMVAILPRSFMSGTYFKAFRAWLRAQGSLDWFHRYHSRSNAFRGDNVLQENVLIKFTKAKPQAQTIEVSVSDGPHDKACTVMAVDAGVILDANPEGHMTLPCSKEELDSLTGNSFMPYGFDDLNLSVVTGKFEDFRNRDVLSADGFGGALPVVYAQHWQHGENTLVWRSGIAKPCFATPTADVLKRSIPRGNYVLVKRISANGDMARCHSVAVLEDANLPSDQWLIDNHVQVITSKDGLSPRQALEIQRHLSSQEVENLLRTKSGTTQLNKDDLRTIRFPQSCAATKQEPA